MLPQNKKAQNNFVVKIIETKFLIFYSFLDSKYAVRVVLSKSVQK